MPLLESQPHRLLGFQQVIHRAGWGTGKKDTAGKLATASRGGRVQAAWNTLLASPGKRDLIICSFLAVVTLALYSPIISHPFIFNYDDDSYVINNAHVQAGLVWKTVAWLSHRTIQLAPADMAVARSGLRTVWSEPRWASLHKPRVACV